jgi:hypothetical protein
MWDVDSGGMGWWLVASAIFFILLWSVACLVLW